MTELLTNKEINDNIKKYGFIFYAKKSKTAELLQGLATDKDRVIHKNIGRNQFLRKTVTVPKNYKKVSKKPPRKWINNYFYNPKVHPIQRKIVPELQNRWKHYLIQYNGGTPFVVYVNKDKPIVSVYRIPDNVYIPEKISERKFPGLLDIYTMRVLHLKPEQIFLGKNFKNSISIWGFGNISRMPLALGNSILLKMKGLNYICISQSIQFFKALSPIVKFMSPVGGSWVTYPFAVDKERNYYLFNDLIIMTNVPEKQQNPPLEFESGPDFKETVAQEPYGYYDQIKNSKKFNKDIKKLKITKKILSNFLY